MYGIKSRVSQRKHDKRLISMKIVNVRATYRYKCRLFRILGVRCLGILDFSPGVSRWNQKQTKIVAEATNSQILWIHKPRV